MRQRLGIFALAAACLIVAFASCSTPHAPPSYSMTRADLMDPEKCATCHADHYREWSGSMHAYASDDPIFLAMNARAQRETNHALGTFCVQCHAPVAVRENATQDGMNLADLPRSLRGVTCYFCHSTDSVDGAHNDPLHLASDGVLRASIADPIENTAHATKYSPLHDRDRLESSSLCGACHDVVNMNGTTIESTFAEWHTTVYAKADPVSQLTCSACHMNGSNGLAANVDRAPTRRVHDHSMAGVDVAFGDFPAGNPQNAAQRALVQDSLGKSIVAKLCVKPPQAGDTVEVTLDNAFVGHDWPSGAWQDRRVWAEVVAYAGNTVVYPPASSAVQEGQSVTSITDPNFWLMRETLTDAQSKEVTMMWQATSANASFLQPSVTNDPTNPAYYHAVTKTYPVPPSADRVTLRVRIIPIGYDVLDDLIASGDLGPAADAKTKYRDAMPVFDVSNASLEWTAAKGFGCVP